MIAPPAPWLWPWLGLLGTYGAALIWLLWPGRVLPRPEPPPTAQIPRQRAARTEARR